jgi:hypothetical protein
MAIVDFGALRISTASDFEDLAFWCEWLQCRDRFSGHLFDLLHSSRLSAERISAGIRTAHAGLQLLAIAAAQSQASAIFEQDFVFAILAEL